MANVFSFSFIRFSDTSTPFTVHLRLPLSAKSCERFHHRSPLGCRGSACVEMMTIDLVIVCSHLTVDTFMTPEFSSYIQISDCHPRTMSLHVVWLSFRVLSYVLHPFCLHCRDSI